MNSRFEKFRKALETGDSNAREAAKQELHKTFSSLSTEEQKFANILLHDIETGDVEILEGKTLRDYINEYMEAAKNDQIHKVAISLGVDEEKLREMMALNLDEKNINEFGRFDNLKATVDLAKSKDYFERISAYAEQVGNVKIPIPKVRMRVDKLLREFIIHGGMDIRIESDFSSYGKIVEKDFKDVDSIPFFENAEWIYYFGDKYDTLRKDVCGKWMYFFNDMAFAKSICVKAVQEGACLEAKHANSSDGVCCFYINGDEIEAHKNLLRFLLNNELIRKTNEGKYYNISFKYDNQTRAGEYGSSFTGDIKLEDFIDLQTGEWK
jgi:type I restriction enzyme R subunit